MKEGLIEDIRSIGHWRVNIRPLQPLADKLSFQKCYEVVDQARVSIRGWDYPHIGHRQDDTGGHSRGDDYVESWCAWHRQFEFWHMYRSGQFLSYNTLRDDIELQRGIVGARVLTTRDAIYSVTEFVEFAHRLFVNGIYRDGLSMHISLNNTAGRQLWAGANRMPFFDIRQTGAENIQITRVLTFNELAVGAIEIALAILVELFDYFGWNPNPTQIRSDQEDFYRGTFL
jgi:hypothetical protein